MKKTDGIKALTNKDLGLAEDVKLSTRYSNTEKCFRTVYDDVLGYYVVPEGRNSPVRIAPIFRADTWFRSDGHVNAVISSYEIGEYLNGDLVSDINQYQVHQTLAKIAAQALEALERNSAALRVPRLKRKKRKP